MGGSHLTFPAVDEAELNPATWHDPKRYAWLLGLIVPLLPFIAWGLRRADRPRRLLVVRARPRVRDLPDPRRRSIGMDAENPPDSIIKWLEQDRYYRWCTYVFIPLQYAGARLRLLAVGARRSLGRRQDRPRAHDGDGQRHRDQHRARARPQARQSRALAVEGRARAERLRPLLHRAQPRPPRARRDARGPGQRAPRRELLGVPAAHASPAACARRGSWRRERLAPHGQSPVDPRNDILNAWAMTVVLFARADRRLRLGRAAVPADPGGRRLLAAGGRQLPRALRPAAPEREDGRYER